jgi:hypothetical protein
VAALDQQLALGEEPVVEILSGCLAAPLLQLVGPSRNLFVRWRFQDASLFSRRFRASHS